jgi:hypothetical protein
MALNDPPNPEVLEMLYGTPKRGRYGGVAQRTEYNGRKYDSKAEAEYAAQLDAMKAAGEIAWWLPQVSVPLGPDFKTRVDFQVAYIFTSMSIPGPLLIVEAHEVKGKETREFAKVRKLWPKYAPFPMHVIKKGNVEIIEGKG